MPTISLCMIVKNEAKTLEKCLAFARPYVDEIVVIDTGSTDGTQAIAQRYADVYDEIEWPNSFAIARNYSFDKGSGDYILILDGDEYIPNPQHWALIRRTAEKSDVAAAQFTITNLMGEDKLIEADRFHQVRLVRNDPSIRYEGRVHNQIQRGIEAYMRRTGYKQIRIGAEVIHTGYALGRHDLKKKYEPRLALLEYELEHAENEKFRSYYSYQLGVSMFVLRDLEKALEYFEAVDNRAMMPRNAFYGHLLAAQAALNLNRPGQALRHANSLLAIDPNEPIVYYTTGLALLLAQQPSDGLLMLLHAFKLGERKDVVINYSVNPLLLLKRMGDICAAGKLDRYAHIFHTYAEQKTYNPQVVLALIAELQTRLVQSERMAA
ncbi:MAG: glycosyltransferase family 2 protein [Bacteroidota bacterium]